MILHTLLLTFDTFPTIISNFVCQMSINNYTGLLP